MSNGVGRQQLTAPLALDFKQLVLILVLPIEMRSDSDKLFPNIKESVAL